MKSSAFGELKKNTIIIAVANLSTKAINFILAPLYSFYLSSEQYGTMDLIVTTVGLLVPLLCLDIYDSTFRFANDKDKDQNVVIETSLLIFYAECIITCIGLAVVNLIFHIPVYVNVCIIAAVLESLYTILLQFARGSGKFIEFAGASIANAVVLLCGSVVFLVLIKFQLTGWIIAFIAAKIISIAYLFMSQRIYGHLLIKNANFEFLKEALGYCMPLMPTAAMWWAMNVSDRYVISLAIGVSATGIYAVANKLPAILSVFENVFYQSWQTTAINLKDDAEKDDIYSSVLLGYAKLLTIGVLGILIILKPFIYFCFASEYYDAWKSAGVLVVAVMIHAIGGNLGVLYTVFKDTKGALRTSFLGASVNIVLNVILVPRFGMHAAAWTTLVGYLSVLLVRWIDASKYVKLTLSKKQVLIMLLFITIQMYVYYLDSATAVVVMSLIFIVYFVINRDIVIRMLEKKSIR